MISDKVGWRGISTSFQANVFVNEVDERLEAFGFAQDICVKGQVCWRRLGRGFKGGILPRKVFDLTRTSLGIEPFDVALFARGIGASDEYFMKILLANDLPRQAPERSSWGYEGGQCDDATTGKQFRDFCNTADIFYPVFVRKAKVVVESAANVVPIQQLGENAFLVKVFFHCRGQGALAGTRQSIEPDHTTLLIEQSFFALSPEGRIKNRMDVI